MISVGEDSRNGMGGRKLAKIAKDGLSIRSYPQRRLEERSTGFVVQGSIVNHQINIILAVLSSNKRLDALLELIGGHAL